MSLDRLTEAVRLCQACPLGVGGRGVPGVLVDVEGESPPYVSLNASERELVMILGEAPGGVEMAKGEPFVGGSGQLLRSMLQEVGLTAYYLSNIAKHQPPKVKGKQQAPDAVAVAACAPFLRAEFELVKPTKLILLGKTAAKLVCGGNFSMGEVVNQTYEYTGHPHGKHGEGYDCGLDERCQDQDGMVMVNEIPALVLYHPSYFLRSRTAPWIQKQVSEWKRSVRMFLGDRPPTYQIERVRCETHG